MSLIDLSQPIHDGMPVYPGDPAVSARPALTIARDGVAVAELALGSHTGTHLDAPAHVIPGGRTVDQVPLDWLVGPAVILRALGAGPATRIDAAAIEGEIPPVLPTIVCVETGWDRHYGQPAMLRHPFLCSGLAKVLWQRGARVLGVDTLSPDPTELLEPRAAGAPGEGSVLPVHRFWLGGGGAIVENLRGLHRLDREPELSLLPIAVAGGDGAPVRAVARV
ncbi:cyclase family protein [Leucobacter luti]|uniref:Kynurenine formamidase n=1 Tax=Leucobacter luti TaxID=340320 RepID=A0A4Q7TG23_9MICO|nr:cyclase family protein [Leucobacter luti]MBL3699640.1 cyclase family protein [Leucobacter luti]RZT59414.1 kynurenine formamidase [Leucobacter luti]